LPSQNLCKLADRVSLTRSAKNPRKMLLEACFTQIRVLDCPRGERPCPRIDKGAFTEYAFSDPDGDRAKGEAWRPPPIASGERVQRPIPSGWGGGAWAGE